jgi:hypothetical protein
LTAGDAVWITTALFHTERSNEHDFAATDIIDRTLEEKLTIVDRRTVELHVYQHCVANLPPQHAQLRMLVETAPGRRRLFRRGDPVDPGRLGSEAQRGKRVSPDRDDVPDKYRYLLDWYRAVYSPAPEPNGLGADPILGLRGLGREIWEGEHPDEYVARLRAGWP